MNFKFKNGFSLAELMVVLLLVSLLASALIPIVTKKHLTLPKRSDHGAYMCYYKDGKLYEKKTVNKYSGQSEEKQVENCVFTPPAKALYFQISAVGGGGGGGDSGYNGGNAHAVWDDLLTISPFGLTQARINELHINYKGKGYFPPVATPGSSDDFSAQFYTYAKSHDSYKGGDTGYRSCSLISGNVQYEKVPGSSGYSVDDCPLMCPTDYVDKGCTEVSGGAYWGWSYTIGPGSSSTTTVTSTCPTGKYTIIPGYWETPTTYKTVCNKCNTCYCGSVERPSCTISGHETCTLRHATKDCNCHTETVSGTPIWHPEEKEPEVVACTKTISTVSSSPSDYSGGQNYPACSCPAGVSGVTNTDCEAARAAILATIASYGSSVSAYRACYNAGDFYPSYSDGMYTGSGGKAGSGVTCYETAGSGASKLVYNINISSQVDASHSGHNGADNAGVSGNKYFHTNSFAATDGEQQCISGMANECGDGSNWGNVQYSEMELSDGSNSFKAKAYNAPKSGTGAKSKSIPTGGINTTTNGKWNGATISDNTYLGTLCNGASSSDITDICAVMSAEDDVTPGEDGINGKCESGSAPPSGFCNISSSATTAYCMQHHSSYQIKMPGTSATVPEYEPGGYGGLSPHYNYRRLINKNFLQYGNAGSPGEIKTIVVRSLKDMDTTISLGRGGAGGVKGSGLDGMSGSPTKMGNVIVANGGKGGRGNLVNPTEELPTYDSSEYANEMSSYNSCIASGLTPIECVTTGSYKYFKTTGRMEGSISTLKSLATNLFKFIKPQKSDEYSELFNQQGKGGAGGGVTHRCWAGQFVVWFEGEILKKTSVFKSTASGKFRMPDMTMETIPPESDTAGYLPQDGQCYKNGADTASFVIDEAEPGADGAILIKW